MSLCDVYGEYITNKDNVVQYLKRKNILDTDNENIDIVNRFIEYNRHMTNEIKEYVQKNVDMDKNLLRIRKNTIFKKCAVCKLALRKNDDICLQQCLCRNMVLHKNCCGKKTKCKICKKTLHYIRIRYKQLILRIIL